MAQLPLSGDWSSIRRHSGYQVASWTIVFEMRGNVKYQSILKNGDWSIRKKSVVNPRDVSLVLVNKNLVTELISTVDTSLSEIIREADQLVLVLAKLPR